MKNYKIKVNDEAESKEAQELFFELGLIWRSSQKEVTNLDATYIYAKDGVLKAGFDDLNFAKAGHHELTLHQLRDLVVLNRNDVKDATHEAACGTYLFLDSSGDWHFFHKHEAVFYTIDGDISTFVDMPITLIKEQAQQPLEPEQGLISGADVPALLKNGQFVQYRNLPLTSINAHVWSDISLEEHEEEFTLGDFINSRFEWRLKPRTIKLELEIPAPFEPKVGEVYWFISSTHRDGYDFTEYEGTNTDHMFMLYGAFKSEQNIIAVRDALRGIKG